MKSSIVVSTGISYLFCTELTVDSTIGASCEQPSSTGGGSGWFSSWFTRSDSISAAPNTQEATADVTTADNSWYNTLYSIGSYVPWTSRTPSVVETAQEQTTSVESTVEETPLTNEETPLSTEETPLSIEETRLTIEEAEEVNNSNIRGRIRTLESFLSPKSQVVPADVEKVKRIRTLLASRQKSEATFSLSSIAEMAAELAHKRRGNKIKKAEFKADRRNEELHQRTNYLNRKRHINSEAMMIARKLKEIQKQTESNKGSVLGEIEERMRRKRLQYDQDFSTEATASNPVPRPPVMTTTTSHPGFKEVEQPTKPKNGGNGFGFKKGFLSTRKPKKEIDSGSLFSELHAKVKKIRSK